jgi:hypothetical protein
MAGENPVHRGTEPPDTASYPMMADSEDAVSAPPPKFDRDEVLVCMALAFCLAGASTSIVYRLLG